ncbi:hypothetical protein FACS1894162_6760 [Bacteroidia bacterium]|nr:hypothetical protein FACS1894162_6760 [Bacteroidia bacterium]
MKMKKKVILMTLLLIGAVSVNAQVRIGGTAVADKAILDLNASNTATNATQGLALPRAASKPAAPTIDGVLIYSAGDVYVSKAGVWEKLGSGTGGDGGDGGDGGVTPPPTDPCGSATVTGESGYAYKVGYFGATAGCWMTENLREPSPSDNNTDYVETLVRQYTIATANNALAAYTFPVQPADSLGTSQAALDSIAKYGYLYTWAGATGRAPISTNEGAVNVTTDTLIQGICPDGWHVPTDGEFLDLELAIAASEAGVYSSTGALALTAADLAVSNVWRPTSNTAASLGNKMRNVNTGTNAILTGTSNAYDAGTTSEGRGFDALLAGYVGNGTYSFVGTRGVFWSASSYNATAGWSRNVQNSQTGANRYNNFYTKSYAYNIRCKKN